MVTAQNSLHQLGTLQMFQNSFWLKLVEVVGLNILSMIESYRGSLSSTLYCNAGIFIQLSFTGIKPASLALSAARSSQLSHLAIQTGECQFGLEVTDESVVYKFCQIISFVRYIQFSKMYAWLSCFSPGSV